MRSIVGGEIKEYTEALNEAREISTKRMIEEAEKLGADAIVCVRFTTSQVMSGAAELLVYGTAVKLVKNESVGLSQENHKSRKRQFFGLRFDKD